MRRLRPSDSTSTITSRLRSHCCARSIYPSAGSIRERHGTNLVGRPDTKAGAWPSCWSSASGKIRLGRYPGFRATGEGVRCETFGSLGADGCASVSEAAVAALDTNFLVLSQVLPPDELATLC